MSAELELRVAAAEDINGGGAYGDSKLDDDWQEYRRTEAAAGGVNRAGVGARGPRGPSREWRSRQSPRRGLRLTLRRAAAAQAWCR